MHPFLTHRHYLSAPNLSHPAPRRRRKSSVDKPLKRLLSAIGWRLRRRKMIAAFQAMDDRLLHDIGVCRTQIARFVDGRDVRERRMIPLVAPAKAQMIVHYEKAA